MLYWNRGFDELEHFLLGVFDFPGVVVVLPRDMEKAKEFAEKHGRGILFVDPDEIDIVLKPDFVFYLARHGAGLETVANKLKQDFAVMVCFGLKKGEPVRLDYAVRDSTAAPIIIYEILRMLRGFRESF